MVEREKCTGRLKILTATALSFFANYLKLQVGFNILLMIFFFLFGYIKTLKIVYIYIFNIFYIIKFRYRYY